MASIRIMRPGVEDEVREVALPTAYPAIRELLTPLLDGGDLEHVTVLHGGQRADMFVDAESVSKGLIRNEEATAVYRNNWLTQHPDAEPESLPAIYGPAVLFSQRVWF